MKKASFIVHQNYVEDVIAKLHETGMMEIIDIAKEEPEILEEAEKASMHPDASVCTTYELRLTRIIDILNNVAPKPGGLTSILHPQLPEIKTVEERSLEELYSYAEGVLGEIEKYILDSEQCLKEFDEKREKITSDIQQIEYLKDFELDLSDIGESDHVIVKVGKTLDLVDLKNAIDQIDNATVYSKQFGSGKEVEWAIVIAAHISKKDEIEKICREKITGFDLETKSGLPKDVLKTLNKDKKEINIERKKITSKLRDFADEQLHDLLALREEIQLEQVRKELSMNFAKTSSTYIIKGWVLEKNENELKTAVCDVSKDYIVCSFETPSANPDNPPTYFKTPKWAAAFKTLLDLFATPKYNEINPTIIMGIFFVLFFGVMLGDAGYGLVILFLSLFGYKKFSKYSEMIKDWSLLGMLLGLTTTIVGFLTNSFFGDLIPRFFYSDPNIPLYSLQLGSLHLPIEPLRDPLTILTIALLFGLIHLNIGILLAIFQSFKNKDFKELITNHFSWILLQIGGGLLIGDSLLHMWTLDTAGFYIAAVLVIVGIILRLMHAGPLGFFDITGFVGDWLSYARLLALGLATAGMALAFNIIAKLFADMIPSWLGVLLLMMIIFGVLKFLKKLSRSKILILAIITIVLVGSFFVFADVVNTTLVGGLIGTILLIILLVLMHVINLGLQALGAGVHSLRLQYVEFFNRFYGGGGHEFKPFSIKREYTKTKKE